MDIQLMPASIASVREMCDCGRRAFADDGLQNAIFPPHLQNPADKNDINDYLEQRMRKRLQSPNWQYVLATTVSSEGHAQLIGYAGWVLPQENESKQEQANNLTGFDAKQRSHAGNAEVYPRGMDIVAFKYALDAIEKAKKEILGEAEQHRVWSLMSLAVDPAFKGRGIASKLVKWGTDRADDDGLPAYLESTPAAVGLYERLGFKVQRRLSVIRNNQSHFLTVMMRIPGSSAET